MRLALCILLLIPTLTFAGEIEEQNKALARRFYEEVWFKNNPGVVDELVAPTYIAHDTGDRKNSMEQASQQKEIAQFFWDRGTMTGTIENRWNGRTAIAGREGRGMELGTGGGNARIQIRSFKGNVRLGVTK